MTDEQYRTKRRPILESIGIDKRAIEYIISLERGTVEAVIGSLKELRKTAVWPGRVCRISTTGLTLVYNGSSWGKPGDNSGDN